MKKHNDFLLDSTIYSRHANYDGMIEQIDNYVKMSGNPIQIILFSSFAYPNVVQYMKKRRFGEFTVTSHFVSNDILVAELKREYGRKEKKMINGKFLLFKHDKSEVYVAVTHENTVFFEEGLLRFIKHKWLVFSQPFYYSWEIESMLNNLSQKDLNNKIMLTKLLKKSRIKNEGSNKSKESDLIWTDVPYKEAFSLARSENAWIEKIYFDFITIIEKDKLKSRKRIMSGAIARNGIFKCELVFKQFFNNIVEKGIDVFVKRKEQLNNRQRTKDANYKGKPFFIEFDEPVFEKKEQNWKLVDVIKNMSNSAYSLIHGNPYVHMTVTDYLDSSSYDIWVLSDNKITISPQTVCSMNALNRLCDHISKEFQEGMVKEIYI